MKKEKTLIEEWLEEYKRKEPERKEAERRKSINRLGGFYLRKWYRLQQNINNLNSLELVEAKILYSSLAELSEQERDFLGAKYFTPLRTVNGVRTLITDKEVADSLDMSIKEYKKEKQRLERNLSILIDKYKRIHQEEFDSAILLVHGYKR